MRKRNKIIALILLFLFFIEVLVPSNVGNIVYAENEVKNEIEEYGFSVDEDLDENGIIDIVDLSKVASKYNSVKGEEAYDNKCDFNGDEIIDIFDMVTLSNKIGAEEPVLLAGDYEETNSLLKFSGSWSNNSNSLHSGGKMKYSTTKGSYVEFKFYGTGFDWYGQFGLKGGKAKVYIDGKEVSTRDAYFNATHYNKLVYSKNKLGLGEHIVKIEVLGEGSSASSGKEISIDRIVINNTDAPNNYYKVYQGTRYIGQYPTKEAAISEAKHYSATSVTDNEGNDVWSNAYRVLERYYDGTNSKVLGRFSTRDEAVNNAKDKNYSYVIDSNGVETWNNGYPGKAKKDVTMLLGPGTSYAKDDSIASGTNVAILNKEGNYYQVEYTVSGNKKRAYIEEGGVSVAANFIIPLANNTNSVMYSKVDQNVYSGPDKEVYSKIDNVARTQEVRILKKENSYSLIEYTSNNSKKRGYVLTTNLSKDKPLTPQGSIKKIVIDPGHGGRDPGAIGPNKTNEKDITLKVGLKVRELLQSYGYTVIMTRTTDEYLTLQERCDIANNNNADFFLSIHANSFGDPSANGTETFSYFRNDPGGEIAKLIQDKLIASLGLTNRGHKTNDFYVLKHTNMPAALTELAFISNPTEEALLISDSFQTKAARAIVDGILAYTK